MKRTEKRKNTKISSDPLLSVISYVSHDKYFHNQIKVVNQFYTIQSCFEYCQVKARQNIFTEHVFGFIVFNSKIKNAEFKIIVDNENNIMIVNHYESIYFKN